MNKSTKTALIVALSLFGAGVLIFLCVSFAVNFDYSRLSASRSVGNSASTENFKAEHIDKVIDEKGQDISFNLASADITVEPSTDGKIHISYDNTKDIHFDFHETDKTITLKQREHNVVNFDFFLISNHESNKVVLSLPKDRDGKLNLGGASSDITVSDIDMKDTANISSVSGEITLNNLKVETLEANSTSGEVKLAYIDTDHISINTVSGEIIVSDISNAIPISLASTSGEVYAENVKTKDFGIQTISGEIYLKRVAGEKLTLSAASGSVELSHTDYHDINCSTISGEISGTLVGSEKDYSVHTSSLSGENSLLGHREHGERTLDFNSTSGSIDINFEG